MALWRRRPATEDVPIDPNRAADRERTAQRTEFIQQWAERLAAAVERVEKVAPILLRDDEPGRGGGRA